MGYFFKSETDCKSVQSNSHPDSPRRWLRTRQDSFFTCSRSLAARWPSDTAGENSKSGSQAHEDNFSFTSLRAASLPEPGQHLPHTDGATAKSALLDTTPARLFQTRWQNVSTELPSVLKHPQQLPHKAQASLRSG